MKHGSLWLFLTWALLPLGAAADDVHYQDFILGDQAVGLGGAYTAIAADPSGIWYNPAGIVDVANTSLSLSANLYGIQDSFVGKREEVIPKDPISKLVVVPSSAGFVQAMGRMDNWAMRPWAFGMSIVVPSFRKLTTTEEGESNDPILGRSRHGYHRVFEDQTLWIGIGAAYRLHARMSLGFGLALAHRSLQDAASSFVASGFVDGAFTQFRTSMMDLNFSNDSLLATAGVKYRLTDAFYLGAMLRSPTMPVRAKGSMRFTRARADAQGNVGFLPTPENLEVKSESKSNGEGRVGLAFVLPQFLTVSVDASVHLPVSYTLVEVPDEAAQKLLLITPTIERNLVVNGNLGVEFQILNRYAIGLGGFTNFSSAPSIPGSPDKLLPASDQVHLFGGSLALGLFSEHTLTRLGVVYSRGSGTDVIAVNHPDQLALDEQAFARVNLTQTSLYFFLASTFRY